MELDQKNKVILFSAVDSSRASAQGNLGLVVLRDLCQKMTVMISCDCPGNTVHAVKRGQTLEIRSSIDVR